MIDPRLMPNNEDVAVLIDPQLLVTQAGKLNMPLIQFLKAYGLTVLYLHDDFHFDKDNIVNRMKLWVKLLELDFSVCGVLTPQDLAWHEMFIAKKQGLPKKIHFNLQEPAEAFNYAVRMMETAINHRLPSQVEVSSALVRHHVKKSPEAKQFKHIKGLMLQLFLDALPYRTHRILVLDHDPQVIDTVKSVTPQKKTQDCPPIAAIQLACVPQPEAYYEKHILKHPMIAIKAIADALCHRRYELSDGSTNPFLRSSANKRATLTALAHALEINHHDIAKSVDELIDECLQHSILSVKAPEVLNIPTFQGLQKRKKSKKRSLTAIPTNYAIISQHRNIFASSHPDNEPKTLALIKLIKATFGDVLVPPIKQGRIMPQPMFVHRIKPREVTAVRLLVERKKKLLKRTTSCPATIPLHKTSPALKS